MASNHEYVFIDEFGDPSLETQKSGVTNYYIIAATLVSSGDLEEVRFQVDKLRKNYFQGSEIKSANVGNRKSLRRIEILKEISKLNVKFYIIAIEKVRVYKDGGLIYKKPFLKFISGLLYKELYEAFPNVSIKTDNHGHPEFRNSFKKYILKNHIPKFFEKKTFNFYDSKDEPLIQISDFIAGTIAKVLDKDKLSDKAHEFLNILDSQIIRIDEWPTIHLPSFSAKLKIGNKFDEKIREISLRQASNFIQRNVESKDNEIIDQVNVLQYLLYSFKFISPFEYVFGDELIKKMSIMRKKHYLHSSIIAKLRDEGVIIASSNKGYKIPVNIEDLQSYIEQVHSMIYPMLNRLDQANKKIQIATKDQINIFDNERYRYLQNAIKSVRKND